MAIREPWLKMAAGAGAPYAGFMRVDSPSDVVMLDPSDPILHGIVWYTTIMTAPLAATTAEQWKGVGNKFFGMRSSFQRRLLGPAVSG